VVLFRARIFALLTAIAVLLPGGAAAPAHYFCRMMERVQPACCCAGARNEHTAVRRAEVRHADCCERLTQPSHATASAAEEPALAVPAAAVLAVLPVYAWLGQAVSSDHSTARQARSPPSLGPPLFIAHCSLLS